MRANVRAHSGLAPFNGKTRAFGRDVRGAKGTVRCGSMQTAQEGVGAPECCL